MNYYFVKTDRGEVIQEKLETINCEMFTDFTELTGEQKTFYLTNPTASIQEIKNCALNIVTLEDYKAQRIEELSQLSKDTSYKLLTIEQRENLDCELPNLPYTQEQRIALNSNCRTEFYRVKNLIESATTIQEVDSAYNSNIYNQITL